MTAIDWQRTVLVLLPPDALERHLCSPVLDTLERHGFAPVRYEVLWHRPPGQDAFHERNITSVWKAYFYRQVDLVFDLGPTLALLVEERPHDDRAPGSAHARLREIKGASHPSEAAPGTIRRDLRAVNAMLGVVHTSDSPEDSLREASVFFGPGLGTAVDDPAELRGLVALLESGAPAETREYDDVVTGLRSRVVAAVWTELTADGRKAAPELARATHAGAGAELAALLPAGHPLAELLSCEYLPGHPQVDLARAAKRMAPYGLTLDPWEHAVLKTSMTFPPLRRGS
ncbi:hypothetical protein Ssi03_35800 [Sphaerisporangium siamense]|uniref:Nucleoside diphosphate kinase n=1 Tax=Sphaerisporangium siamense TaxID=795645 RepID=A0A7W7G9K4_9ACTN|nr:nucleoside-diphosphate kinase [Sphaerisporangium siamense]MBB4701467.1 nucleoside diphosphate kinase [Sphaerisporangium siamense]GII85590.1 hypothetical protein Ssi03_35800 [Sphaerisporangium siamense]